MKKFLLILLTLTIFSVNILAQNSKELKDLRREANLPIDEIIRVNKDIKFPSKQSLKILLAVNQSEYDSRKLKEWIEKWNKKNGKKYGNVELVSEANDADVIVAQIRNARSEYVLESKVSIGKSSKIGNNSDDNDGFRNKTIRSGTDYRRLALPIRSYLLVRSNGFWTIVFRNVETSVPEEQLTNPHTKIRGALKKRLKNR